MKKQIILSFIFSLIILFLGCDPPVRVVHEPSPGQIFFYILVGFVIGGVIGFIIEYFVKSEQVSQEINEMNNLIAEKEKEIKKLNQYLNSDIGKQEVVIKRQEKFRKTEDFYLKKMREDEKRIREEGEKEGLGKKEIDIKVGLSNSGWLYEIEKYKRFRERKKPPS